MKNNALFERIKLLSVRDLTLKFQRTAFKLSGRGSARYWLVTLGPGLASSAVNHSQPIGGKTELHLSPFPSSGVPGIGGPQ